MFQSHIHLHLHNVRKHRFSLDSERPIIRHMHTNFVSQILESYMEVKNIQLWFIRQRRNLQIHFVIEQ